MRTLLFIVLTLIYFKGYSQTHKAIYSFRIEANPITESTKFKDDVGPLAEDNEYYLYFNKENSYYTSLNAENDTKDMSDGLGGTYYPAKYNYKTKMLQHNTEFDKKYVVNHSNIPVWTITNETKEIGGYNCIKAYGVLSGLVDSSRSSTVEAWFAPELPYSIGPYKSVGLPGLVVYSIYKNYMIFKLEKVIFNDNSVDIDAITFEGDKLNEEQYIELLKQEINF